MSPLFSDEEIARIVAKAPPWDDGPDTTAFERMAIDLRNSRTENLRLREACESALHEIESQDLNMGPLREDLRAALAAPREGET